jgi:type IX secretion system protein PorV
MNRMKPFSSASILILLFLVALPALHAGERSGTVSELFLKIGTSARAIGMGGAQVAVAEGVSSMAYNPAGIMGVSNYGFGATYTAWLADMQHSYAGLVKNIPGVGALGVSVTLLTTDDIPETTPSSPEGTGSTFRASDYAFSVAFARQVTEQFRVGINGKIIQSYLMNKDLGASSFAFDIGTLYDIPILQSHVGVSLTNIGKDVKFINETYSLPTALRFGVLLDVLKNESNSFVTTLQIARVNDADEQYNFGTEYVFNNMVALRGGWKFAYDQENVTAGFGVRLNSLGFNSTIDYGFNNFKYLPGTHSFTFEMQF